MDTVAEGLAPGPEGMLLRFFYDSVPNEQASIKEGRAIFDTALYVDIISPGQQSSTPRFELERTWCEQSIRALGLTEPYKRSYKYREFAEQIEKFKRLEAAEDLGGTPLKMWPRIDRGLAANLAVMHIHTVEALAALSDTNLDNIGLGARDLREQARSFLAASESGADVSVLTDRATNAERELHRIMGDLALANKRIIELEAMLRKYEPETTTPVKGKKDFAL
jgi:hypothetical protein